MPNLPPTATGAHERVRLRRTGQSVVIHGTLVDYDPATGNMSLLMDYQKPGDEKIAFTSAGAGVYNDPAGLEWHVVS